MKNNPSDGAVCLRLWFYTLVTLNASFAIYWIITEHSSISIDWIALVFIISAIGSLPACIILFFTVYRIEWLQKNVETKFLRLLLLLLIICSLYGLAAACLFSSFTLSNPWLDFLETFSAVTGVLFACSCVTCALNYKLIKNYFTSYSNNQINICMENNDQTITSNSYSNKILIKGIITGVLILIMLIPMMFIQDLVTEREQWQKEVAEEVSNKWASAQTITAPYLVIPYSDNKATNISTSGLLTFAH